MDATDLPAQRRSVDRSVAWCLTCDTVVAGKARLCGTCKPIHAAARQARRRAQTRKTFTVHRDDLEVLHEKVDGLAPLINDLTVAYNNRGNLRDEVHQIMMAIKTIERAVRTRLPDPR